MNDQFIWALTVWREARGEPYQGQVAVAWEILNAAKKYSRSIYAECTHPLRYSSVTYKKDPQLANFPLEKEPNWVTIQHLIEDIVAGKLTDPTNGATLYYADTIPFPESWDKTKVQETVHIGHHIFFREL